MEQEVSSRSCGILCHPLSYQAIVYTKTYVGLFSSFFVAEFPHSLVRYATYKVSCADYRASSAADGLLCLPVTRPSTS